MLEGYRKLYGDADLEALSRIRGTGQSFIEGKLRGNKEPGEFQESIHFLARGLGLLETAFPVNEDWKWIAWHDYYQQIAEDLPIKSRQFLHWLVEGRPLKFGAIDGNSAYYAWLEAEEIERLFDDLKELHERNPAIEFMVDGFHNELLHWLEACRGKLLLLLAS
jgi:hypothetical protein